MSLGRKLGLGVRVTFSGHSCVPGFGGVCAEGVEPGSGRMSWAGCLRSGGVRTHTDEVAGLGRA